MKLRWHVGGTDEHAAETRLLPILLHDGQIAVKSFGKSKQTLEDVFVYLVWVGTPRCESTKEK